MSPRVRAWERFVRTCEARPTLLARAPGRINRFGDHSGHQDGLVLSMAIDREVRLALRVASAGVGGAVSVDVAPPGPPQQAWGLYVEGMLSPLAEAGHRLVGWDGAVAMPTDGATVEEAEE